MTTILFVTSDYEKEGEKDHMYVIGEKKKIPHLIKEVNLIYSYSF
jgi:hypothetical protein